MPSKEIGKSLAILYLNVFLKTKIMDNEVDILNLDLRLLETFQKEYENIGIYKEKINELQKSLDTIQKQQSPEKSSFIRSSSGRELTRAVELQKNIDELESKIERIESKMDMNFYISESTELLEKYKKLLKIPIIISFTGKKEGNNKVESEMKEIVQKYLAIYSKYGGVINPVATKGTKSEKKVYSKIKMCCENCQSKEFITDEHICICAMCGSEHENVNQHATSYKDGDRVNITTKYTYDPRVHFRDCINQYQGKQNCNIDEKVYCELEAVLDQHHLLCGDKSTRKEVRFANITKDHILMFLKELEYAKHYENVNLIHYVLTGKKPDDISHLEEILLNDFGKLVDTYDELFKNKVNRTNFISTQFVLYQLLQKHKHPCKQEDFIILKTNDRKAFHDDICRDLFAHLGWNYTSVM